MRHSSLNANKLIMPALIFELRCKINHYFSSMQENKQEKSPIKQNILLYLNKKGITPYEFYKKSGVTRGVLQQNTGISEDNIAKFLAFAPDINVKWLITGKGAMVENAPEPENTATHVNKESKEGIPLIPFEAMAGALTAEQNALDYECERYVVPAFKGADFLIRVAGDSMTPTYRCGDLVACQWVPLADAFFQWNKTYVLDTKQGPLIKRIKRGSDEEHILIVSDNPDYEPFELSRSQFNGVALVRGLVRIE